MLKLCMGKWECWWGKPKYLHGDRLSINNRLELWIKWNQKRVGPITVYLALLGPTETKKPTLLKPIHNYKHHSPTSITAQEMFQCQTSWSGRSSTIKKHTKGVEYISVTVFWCFVCRNPSEAGARRNTPKGEDKHP